jgi:hypothetical protein
MVIGMDADCVVGIALAAAGAPVVAGTAPHAIISWLAISTLAISTKERVLNGFISRLPCLRAMFGAAALRGPPDMVIIIGCVDD